MDKKKARVLLVDDDPLQQELARDILQESYEVLIASSGSEGVMLAHASLPALILMDILMEDMTGYEACSGLRADPLCTDIPVIFLSGLTDPEDRLRAYEAGGNDFLAKPFSAAELLSKIGGVIAAERERQELAASAQSAFQAAMAAMTSASEQGLVMEYVSRTYRCAGYGDLAQATIEVASAYGLTASVQLRGEREVVSCNARGPSSALETAVLSNLQSCGRIVNFGARYAFNFDSVTLLISDMPVDDEARCGRLRDHLAVVVESAHARVQSIMTQQALQRQQQRMMQLFQRVQALLARIDARGLRQKEHGASILQAMLGRMEDAFLFLGLTEAQEAAVADMLRQSAEETLRNFGPDAGEDAVVAGLLADMSQLVSGSEP